MYVKTAEQIEMPFGVDAKEPRILDGVKVGLNQFAAAKGDNMAMRPFVESFDHSLLFVLSQSQPTVMYCSLFLCFSALV